ncbi:MAG: SRPBCC family protein [Chloroflexi bacterium]|nr:SRPBCC family protein [Chloroflexota bacterium]
MADMIRYAIDVAARPADVYALAEDPKLGQLFVPAREVAEVIQTGGRVKSFTTKNGKGEFTTQDFPKRWEAEYFWKGYRARYEFRLEPHSDKVTRLMLDVALQPQSFMGRVFASKARFELKGRVAERLAAIQKQFSK